MSVHYEVTDHRGGKKKEKYRFEFKEDLCLEKDDQRCLVEIERAMLTSLRLIVSYQFFDNLNI